MLQQSQPEDFVIATGETNTLEIFIATVFKSLDLDLDWQDYVISDPELIRPSEIMVSRGNPAKAFKQLNWQAKLKMNNVIKLIIEAELDNN